MIFWQCFVIFQMIFCQTSAPPQASPVTNDNAEEYTADEGMYKQAEITKKYLSMGIAQINFTPISIPELLVI